MFGKRKKKLRALEESCNALLLAIDLSSTSLWKPCLEDTEDCIVLSSTEYRESDDEDAKLIELPGISKELEDLVQTLNR
jgi:hypothetical protein